MYVCGGVGKQKKNNEQHNGEEEVGVAGFQKKLSIAHLGDDERPFLLSLIFSRALLMRPISINNSFAKKHDRQTKPSSLARS